MYQDQNDPRDPQETKRAPKADNPRQLLVEIHKQNPRESKDKIIMRFIAKIKKNDLFNDLVIREWTILQYGRLIGQTILSDRSKFKKSVDKAKDAIRSRILLGSLIMPNGKALRDCTGTECVKFGSWFTKVGKKVGRKLVGKVLTEDELWKMKTR